MKLGEKIRYLREVEGSLRGLERAMSQLELVKAIDVEVSKVSRDSQMPNSKVNIRLARSRSAILRSHFK